MKKSPVLITDDEPTKEDLMALIERAQGKERLHRIEQWVKDGHISIIGSGADSIKLRFDTEEFVVSNFEYPSKELIARIALGIAAGVSDRSRDEPIRDYQTIAPRYRASDAAMSYTMVNGAGKMWLEDAHHIMGGDFIDRTEPKPLKQRGLRP